MYYLIYYQNTIKSDNKRSTGVLSFHINSDEISTYDYKAKCNLTDCITKTPSGKVSLELKVVDKIPEKEVLTTNRLLVKFINFSNFKKDNIINTTPIDLFFKVRADNNCQFEKTKLYNNVTDSLKLNDELVITYQSIDSIITFYIIEDNPSTIDNIIGTIKLPTSVIEESKYSCVLDIESDINYSGTMEFLFQKLPSKSDMIGKDTSNNIQRLDTISKLKRLFYKIDKDNSGRISFEELSYSMLKYEKIRNLFLFAGFSGSASDVKRLFEEIDTNGDGSIDWDEFNIYISTLLKKIDIALERCERCSRCGEKPGIRLCKECNMYFCISCCISHHNDDMRELRKHTFYSLVEGGEYKPIIIQNEKEIQTPHYMSSPDRKTKNILYSSPAKSAKKVESGFIPLDSLDVTARKYAAQANMVKSQYIQLKKENDNLKILYKSKCKDFQNFMSATLNVTAAYYILILLVNQ